MAEILVVDDTRDVSDALVRLLQGLGHAAVAVYNGGEALRVIRSLERLPDLVILDQMMPHIDGLEVLRVLRQDPRTASLRVVIFSGIMEPLFQLHAIGRGADAYWGKADFDYATLGERIAALLAPTGGPLPRAIA